MQQLKRDAMIGPCTVTVLVDASSRDSQGACIQAGCARNAAGKEAFVVLWHPRAVEDASMRVAAFDHGCNMVTCNPSHLSTALAGVASQSCMGAFSCQTCGMGNMSSNDLWVHMPLYHIYAENVAATCMICQHQTWYLQTHVHEAHHPKEPYKEIRLGIGSGVIVHRQSDNRFLMVQEFAHQGFWVPGGGLDPGEKLRDCAVRECLEEAGVEVELKGLLEVQWKDMKSHVWRFVTFYAVLKDDQQAVKTVPDYESAGACWVSADELEGIPLRDDYLPMKWYPEMAKPGGFNAAAYPMELPSDLLHLFSDVRF